VKNKTLYLNAIGKSAKESEEGFKSLWFGNLPYSVTWQALRDRIREVGVSPIRTDISRDFKTTRSCGHDTALFESAADARKVIVALKGVLWSGRPIEVREDRKFSQEKLDMILKDRELKKEKEFEKYIEKVWENEAGEYREYEMISLLRLSTRSL